MPHTLYRSRLIPAPPRCRPSRVLHVCDDYLVVDKPRGLPCMRHESNAAEEVAACAGAALGLTGLEVGGAVQWAPCEAVYVGGSLPLPRSVDRRDTMPGIPTSARGGKPKAGRVWAAQGRVGLKAGSWWRWGGGGAAGRVGARCGARVSWPGSCMASLLAAFVNSASIRPAGRL